MDGRLPSEPSPDREWRRLWPFGAFLFALLLVRTWPVLGRPFFADDYLFLEQVRDRGLWEALASADPLGNFARPLGRQAWFWFLSHGLGEDPFAARAASLLLFALSLMLFARLCRRWFDPPLTVFACSYVALHHAAEVPLRWASGAQDLLACLFALAALVLLPGRARSLAPLALLAALLSKETVALVPCVALAIEWREHGLRSAIARTWSLFAVTALWALGWLRFRSGTVLAAPPADLGQSVLAALTHAFQVAAGFEAFERPHTWMRFALLAATACFAALGCLWVARSGAPIARTEPRRAGLVGLVWLCTGALPVTVVVSEWSAYYYLWAVFGAALSLAALVSRLRPLGRAAVLAAGLLASALAASSDTFALVAHAWKARSHVTPHYVERSVSLLERYAASMRRAQPMLPHGSTVFFADVPLSAGWQTADGPVLRWVYRDSTLRSYFVNDFGSRHSGRGPIYFFVAEGDSLADHTRDRELLPSLALSALLVLNRANAEAILARAIEQSPGDVLLRRWHGWVAWSTKGDTTELFAPGMAPIVEQMHRTPPPWRAAADTTERLAELVRFRDGSPFSPAGHARLVPLLLARGQTLEATVEAYAFLALAPDDPDAYRKWATVQLSWRQERPALQTLEHLRTLLARTGTRDAEVDRVTAELRRRVHGDLARKTLR